MILYINTTSNKEMIVALYKKEKLVKSQKIRVDHNQAEKLIVSIDKLLKKNKHNLQSLQKIIVANYGSSFTALRIGVITANALGYALKIPVEAENANLNKPMRRRKKMFSGYDIVEPDYDREPNIGLTKKSLV